MPLFCGKSRVLIIDGWMRIRALIASCAPSSVFCVFDTVVTRDRWILRVLSALTLLSVRSTSVPAGLIPSFIVPVPSLLILGLVTEANQYVKVFAKWGSVMTDSADATT